MAEFGPMTGLLRLEAGRVCVAWTQFREATEALEAAREKRERGLGRRPSERSVERFARRQGLADASYSQALATLRLLVAADRAAHPRDLLDGMLEDLRRAPMEGSR